jgi:hypothetical protein
LNPQHRNYNRRQRRRRDHPGRDLREHQDPQGGVARREDAAVEHAEEAQVGHPGQDLHKEARRCVAGTPGAEPIDEGHAGEVEHLSYKSESSTDVGDDLDGGRFPEVATLPARAGQFVQLARTLGAQDKGDRVAFRIGGRLVFYLLEVAVLG